MSIHGSLPPARQPEEISNTGAEVRRQQVLPLAAGGVDAAHGQAVYEHLKLILVAVQKRLYR